MRLLLICTFSIFFCFNSFAQEEVRLDTLTNTPDTVTIIDERPFSVGVYGDYGKLLTYWSNFEKKMEFGAVVQYKAWGVGVEYGLAEITPLRPYRNGDAYVNGTYFGGFLQYYVRIDDNNNLFGGFGYFNSTFNDEITFEIESDLWGKYEEVISRENLTASWWTIRIGSEQKLNRFLYLGGVFEFRIKNHLDETESLMPYAIPGFGRANSSNTPALNFYLLIKI
ncbi:MAG: DUF6048 family protein [Candidatus Cyclobacteriaceae bacterium M2_1C_046]